MFMTPIDPPIPPASYRVVRLVRRWAAATRLGFAPLPSMVRFGKRIGVSPEAAIALASMFQLTEACLGRPLETECCCSPAVARDERAVLMMLAAPLPDASHQAFPPIPHGLPGALHWAVVSVQKLLGEPAGIDSAGGRQCPFSG